MSSGGAFTAVNEQSQVLWRPSANPGAPLDALCISDELLLPPDVPDVEGMRRGLLGRYQDYTA